MSQLTCKAIQLQSLHASDVVAMQLEHLQQRKQHRRLGCLQPVCRDFTIPVAVKETRQRWHLETSCLSQPVVAHAEDHQAGQRCEASNLHSQSLGFNSCTENAVACLHDHISAIVSHVEQSALVAELQALTASKKFCLFSYKELTRRTVNMQASKP